MGEHTPKENGWKYKAFNYDDKQFNDINHMLIELEEELSMKQKYIVFKLVENLYNERVKNEKGNNSIGGI
tara:strand:- start:443 stop:652 length:210 start_codon:yes stop_codon:yes gene_type:complete